MPVQDKVRALRTDARVLSEVARLQKNATDMVLRQAESLEWQATALERTVASQSEPENPRNSVVM